jgi:hypothetical protein
VDRVASAGPLVRLDLVNTPEEFWLGVCLGLGLGIAVGFVTCIFAIHG